MSRPLLVVGSVAFDTVETRAGRREEILGGAAVYISLSASRFAPVRLVGVVGEGDFPEENVRLLTSRGVDVEGLERRTGETMRWSGVYAEDFSTRTTLETRLGVFERFDPTIPPAYTDSGLLMLGNIDPGLQLRVLDQISGDCFVATDTMNLWIDTARDELEKVIARTDLFVINDEESFQLTAEPQVAVAAEKILSMGPRYLVIKRGEHGALLFGDDTLFFAPAFPLREVVDPTGAGDCFAGALMGYLAAGREIDGARIRRGMIHGAAVASTGAEGFGTERVATLERDHVDRRYDELRDLVSVD